jgi:hypothetical protein
MPSVVIVTVLPPASGPLSGMTVVAALPAIVSIAKAEAIWMGRRKLRVQLAVFLPNRKFLRMVNLMRLFMLVAFYLKILARPSNAANILWIAAIFFKESRNYTDIHFVCNYFSAKKSMAKCRIFLHFSYFKAFPGPNDVLPYGKMTPWDRSQC